VVLEGEMTIIVDGIETVLGKYDSCTIPPNEIRKIENRNNHACTMLVVIPYPPEAK
jgi:mannose-6-phosphate isomerase-like protein (cupin superfamily)